MREAFGHLIPPAMLSLFEARPEIAGVWLFPPRASARGNGPPSTDLGLLFMEGLRPPDPDAWIADLVAQLSTEGVADPRVVLLEDADPVLRHRAIERGHPVHSRDPGRIREFRAQTWLDYVDAGPASDRPIAAMRRVPKPGPGRSHDRGEALRQHAERLRAIFTSAAERFTTDRIVQDAILFNLIQACQAAEELAVEWLGDDGAADLGEATDPLRSLANNGVLSADLASRVAAVIRLRNLVLYRYAELDLSVVRKHLSTAVEALTELGIVPPPSSRPNGT